MCTRAQRERKGREGRETLATAREGEVFILRRRWTAFREQNGYAREPARLIVHRHPKLHVADMACWYFRISCSTGLLEAFALSRQHQHRFSMSLERSEPRSLPPQGYSSFQKCGTGDSPRPMLWDQWKCFFTPFWYEFLLSCSCFELSLELAAFLIVLFYAVSVWLQTNVVNVN